MHLQSSAMHPVSYTSSWTRCILVLLHGQLHCFIRVIISFVYRFHDILTLIDWQICRALAYIHGGIGVCHRDIKPQNLLVCNWSLDSILFFAWVLFANKICCCRLIPIPIKSSSVTLEVQKFWYGSFDSLLTG